MTVQATPSGTGKASVILMVLVVLNSIFLVFGGDATVFYIIQVLLHPVLGGLAAGFIVWWIRQCRYPGMTIALSIGLSLAAGLFLIFAGNQSRYSMVLLVHGLAGLIGLSLALGQVFFKHRLLQIWLCVLLVVMPTYIFRDRGIEYSSVPLVNPDAPYSMVGEVMGGSSGPFFPSSVHTSNGELVNSRVFTGSESCGRPGCHGDVVEQWKGSAHHFSSFNNQWYRKSIEYYQDIAGMTGPKWCAGCHDPALLFSGAMDQPVSDLLNHEAAHTGISCVACHLVSSVRSTMGQADYEFTVPDLHRFADSDNPWLQKLHDLVVRLDPEPHRRTFMKPFFRGPQAAQFCSVCHKTHLDKPVNGYRWVRGFNEYDNWQASGVSGFGARSFYYPREPQDCIDCHMPLVASGDAGNKNGLVKSHRFPGANTALPAARNDGVQLKTVIDFLQDDQVSVDIFALVESDNPARNNTVPAPGGHQSTMSHFATGEEQAFAVGASLASSSDPREFVTAPLDRQPISVHRGTSMRVDVVVRTRGVGHFFPGGTVDAYDCWLELKAIDDKGQVIFWSGEAAESGPVETGAHFYRSLMIDEHGNPINKRNAFAARAVVYVRLIPPGAADVVRFRLDIPESAGSTVTLTANLKYRKFAWFLTQWSFAGKVQSSNRDSFSLAYDDRIVSFTAPLTDQSGKTITAPTVPIVVMASDVVNLTVSETPQDHSDNQFRGSRNDAVRWNDYGIGLFLQNDLRNAAEAFKTVTHLAPDFVDGWVNLARTGLAEGNPDSARSVLKRALGLDPELPRARYFMGIVEKESGNFDRALVHLRYVSKRYPYDRVVLNQIGRILFLKREYSASISALQKVLAIDPEDLMAHYTLMLATRGDGDMDRSDHHRALYQRFKADESSQHLTGPYLRAFLEDNNERQPIHEHSGQTKKKHGHNSAE